MMLEKSGVEVLSRGGINQIKSSIDKELLGEE